MSSKWVFKDAIDDLAKAIRADPKGETAYQLRGLCKSTFEDYRGGINDYNRAKVTT